MPGQAQAQMQKRQTGREHHYFRPPRALPRGTPTFASMPLGTRGRAHARNGARAGPSQTEPLRNPPGHAHLREHAREDEVARMENCAHDRTTEPQATLTYVSMPLGCGRPAQQINTHTHTHTQTNTQKNTNKKMTAVPPIQQTCGREHRMLSLPGRQPKPKRGSRGNLTRAPPPQIQPYI